MSFSPLSSVKEVLGFAPDATKLPSHPAVTSLTALTRRDQLEIKDAGGKIVKLPTKDVIDAIVQTPPGMTKEQVRTELKQLMEQHPNNPEAALTAFAEKHGLKPTTFSKAEIVSHLSKVLLESAYANNPAYAGAAARDADMLYDAIYTRTPNQVPTIILKEINFPEAHELQGMAKVEHTQEGHAEKRGLQEATFHKKPPFGAQQAKHAALMGHTDIKEGSPDAHVSDAHQLYKGNSSKNITGAERQAELKKAITHLEVALIQDPMLSQDAVFLKFYADVNIAAAQQAAQSGDTLGARAILKRLGTIAGIYLKGDALEGIQIRKDELQIKLKAQNTEHIQDQKFLNATLNSINDQIKQVEVYNQNRTYFDGSEVDTRLAFLKEQQAALPLLARVTESGVSISALVACKNEKAAIQLLSQVCNPEQAKTLYKLVKNDDDHRFEQYAAASPEEKNNPAMFDQDSRANTNAITKKPHAKFFSTVGKSAADDRPGDKVEKAVGGGTMGKIIGGAVQVGAHALDFLNPARSIGILLEGETAPNVKATTTDKVIAGAGLTLDLVGIGKIGKAAKGAYLAAKGAKAATRVATQATIHGATAVGQKALQHNAIQMAAVGAEKIGEHLGSNAATRGAQVATHGAQELAARGAQVAAKAAPKAAKLAEKATEKAAPQAGAVAKKATEKVAAKAVQTMEVKAFEMGKDVLGRTVFTVNGEEMGAKALAHLIKTDMKAMLTIAKKFESQPAMQKLISNLYVTAVGSSQRQEATIALMRSLAHNFLKIAL